MSAMGGVLRQVSLIGLSALCMWLAARWRSREPIAPLGFRAEFGVRDAEMGRVRAFLREVDRACATGDVDGLLRRLTPSYRTALERHAAELGRQLSPQTLREVGALLPPAVGDPRAFVLGRSRNRQVVVVLRRDLLDIHADPSRVCLIELGLEWNGRTFALDRPVLRHVARRDAARTAAQWADASWRAVRGG